MPIDYEKEVKRIYPDAPLMGRIYSLREGYTQCLQDMQRDSIEFAEWLHTKGYAIMMNHIVGSDETKTTEQLYKLFQQSKTK